MRKRGAVGHDHVELSSMHEEVANHLEGLRDGLVIEARAAGGDDIFGDLGVKAQFGQQVTDDWVPRSQLLNCVDLGKKWLARA
jgi:hypothetical protein